MIDLKGLVLVGQRPLGQHPLGQRPLGLLAAGAASAGAISPGFVLAVPKLPGLLFLLQAYSLRNCPSRTGGLPGRGYYPYGGQKPGGARGLLEAFSPQKFYPMRPP